MTKADPRTIIRLSRHERILAAVPEYVYGPGWSNAVVWVHVHDTANNRVRTECIQPDGLTAAMRVLFSAGAVMCDALRNAVPTEHARDYQ